MKPEVAFTITKKLIYLQGSFKALSNNYIVLKLRKWKSWFSILVHDILINIHSLTHFRVKSKMSIWFTIYLFRMIMMVPHIFPHYHVTTEIVAIH